MKCLKTCCWYDVILHDILFIHLLLYHHLNAFSSIHFSGGVCFGFRHNVIPIVMGARQEDYLALAPPGSYIDVRSFSGPRELAQYLKLLAADRKLYNKYFEWKKTWSTIGDRYWCRLCMMLHLRDDIGYFTWYEDYQMWWNSVCGTSCLSSSVFVVLKNVILTFLIVHTRFCYAGT